MKCNRESGDQGLDSVTLGSEGRGWNFHELQWRTASIGGPRLYETLDLYDRTVNSIDTKWEVSKEIVGVTALPYSRGYLLL